MRRRLAAARSQARRLRRVRPVRGPDAQPRGHVLRRPDRDPPVSAEIYDPVLRQLAIDTIRDHGIEVHERGTVVVIGGPRFSTKAESKWFSDAGWEVINMTQYPEAWLCRELGMAVVNISLITDYDAASTRAPRRSTR